MVGRYMPPHLRNKEQGNAIPDTAPPVQARPPWMNLNQIDIHYHFWPATENPEDKEESFSTDHSRTLHDSRSTPGRLAYILLFDQANPRWETDYIIFTKSSLDLLPTAQPKEEAGKSSENQDDTNSETSAVKATEGPDGNNDMDSQLPIAVFKQVAGKQRTAGFKFEGWFNVEKVDLLEPQSDAVVKMLKQKWTFTDRNGNTVLGERSKEEWERSLKYRWAVVKLARNEKSEQERGPPKIETAPLRPMKEQKSVNEKLAEMRMNDSGCDVSTTKDEDSTKITDGETIA